MINKISILLIIAAAAVSSCKKDNPAPIKEPQPEPAEQMEYTNLNNREVKYQQGAVTLDVNKDGKADLFFEARLVGDHINKVDKRQYYLLSSIYTAVPVNINEQIAPMNADEVIPLSDFKGNNWYGGSEIILMEHKEFANGTIVWRGNWLDKEKKYLPLQVFKNGKRFNGWVELTADKNGERLMLHRMAISKLAEKDVKAGK